MQRSQTQYQSAVQTPVRRNINQGNFSPLKSQASFASGRSGSINDLDNSRISYSRNRVNQTMVKNDSRTSLKRKTSVKPQLVKNKSKMLIDTENELKRLLKEK